MVGVLVGRQTMSVYLRCLLRPRFSRVVLCRLFSLSLSLTASNLGLATTAHTVLGRPPPQAASAEIASALALAPITALIPATAPVAQPNTAAAAAAAGGGGSGSGSTGSGGDTAAAPGQQSQQQPAAVAAQVTEAYLQQLHQQHQAHIARGGSGCGGNNNGQDTNAVRIMLQ